MKLKTVLDSLQHFPNVYFVQYTDLTLQSITLHSEK